MLDGWWFLLLNSGEPYSQKMRALGWLSRLKSSHRIHGTNGIFTYMNDDVYMVNVGRFTIHGSYGICSGHLLL